MYKIPANTLFMGKKLVFVPECHSTNTLALELGQKRDLPDGTLVITNNQRKGRGQQGNAWITEPGKNLTFSIIVKPTFLAIKDQFLLNMAVSLGIYDFVQSKLTQRVRVKWPNDIMANDLKVCGILIENQIQGNSFSNAVVGVGLNVNQKAFFAQNASSISMFTGEEYDLPQVLDALIVSMEKWYVQLKQNRANGIRDAYLAALYRRNETMEFKTRSEIFEGVITGVDEAGRLIISTNGTMRLFNNKEVQFCH